MKNFTALCFLPHRSRPKGPGQMAKILILFSLLLSLITHAQQIQSGTGAPAAAFEVANGTRDFTVTVLGGTTSSGSLVVTLPAGYVYESGSAIGSGGLTVSQTSVSGNTATLNLSGIPATGTNATFTYKARASCEAIGEAGNQASYVLTPSGGSAQPEILSNAFNLLNAKINILNLANAPNTAGSVGDTYTRTYQIRNDGFGSIDTLYVTDVSGNGVAHLSHSVSTTNNGATVTVDLISSTPSGSNTAYLYRFIVSSTAQDNHLGQGEYFTFTQNLQISSCTDLNTALNAWYGTGPNPQVCSGQNDTQTTALAIDNSKTPNLSVAFVSAEDLSCAPASGWITARVTNTGTSPATSVNLRFGMTTYNSVMNPGNQNNWGGFAATWIDEADGVEVSSDGGATWADASYTTSSFISNAINTTANGKPLDVIVNLASIAPGQSILVRFKKHIDCNNTCAPGEIHFMKEALLSGSYKNNCEEGNYALPYKQLRDYSNLRGVHVPEMGVDAVGGTPYWVQYKINQWYVASNIWDNQMAGPGAYTEMVINLPACLTADLSNLTLTDNSGSESVTPDMVFADADGIHIRFNLTVGSGLNLQNKILRLKTTVDCAVACPSPQITSKIIFKQSATCPCIQVLGCTSWEPKLHCPACTLPLAILNKESTGKRITLGLPDDNNDGKADAPGSNYPANLKINYFTVGDQVEITTSGEVTGAGSFDYAYLETTAPTQPALTLLGTAKAVITDVSTSTSHTLTGLPVSGTYPNFKTDISKAALIAAGVPATFTYEPGDKIVVTLTFDYPAAGNIIFNPDGSGHLTFNEQQTVIFKNLLYGGLAANPAPADQLACDAFSATLQHVGNNWFYSNGSRNLSYNGCLPDDTGDGTFFASDVNNWDSGRQQNAIFPYEINRFVQPKEFVFTLPAGLEAVNTRITIYGQGGAPFVVNKATPDGITGQDYHYDLQAIINTLKGSSPSFFDEGMAIVSHPILRATCQASASGNLSNKIIYTYGTDPTVYTATNNWPYTVTSQGNLNTVATSAIKTVSGNTVSWEIQVSNSGNVSEMENVWIGRNAAGGGSVSITSVQKLPGSGAASGTTVPASGDIYQLGAIPASTSQYYLVTGTFNNCNQDNLQLAYGWNCSGYPASVAAAVCSDDVDLTVIPTPANLQVSLLSQPVPTYPDGTVDLCQELEYIAEVKNPAQGTAFDLKFTVQKPSGVAYIANSYQLSPTILPAAASLVNVNNDALVVETATSITFTIPASVAANLPYNQGYTIRYKVRTLACDFVSGTKMNLQALGNNGCGAPIIGTRQQTQTVRIKGENANPNGYTISSNVPAVDACNPTPVTYTFSAVNDGPVATYAGEKLVITIPQPFTLGAVTGISNFTSGAVPVVTSTATATTYTWTMPLGVAAGQTISFSAPLSATATDLATVSCSTLPIHELIAYTFESKCEPSGPVCTGSLQAEGENDATGIVINKPAFAITAFTAGTPTSGNTLEGTVTVANTNGVATGLPQNAVIKVYHDANSNGVVDATDTQIGSKTVSLTTTTSQVFNYSFATDFLGDFCPAIVELTPECACENPVVFIYTDCETILPVTLHSFTASPSEAGVLLKWSTVTETNSGRFEIQQSTDAKTWKAIGTVDAAGDSPVMSHYSFTDVAPANGQNYYRLKMIDLDGSFDYSKIETVLVDAQSIQWVSLYPNPVTDHFALKSDETMVIKRVDIYDQKGNLVHSTQEKPFNRINVEKLNAGIYQVKVTGAGGEISIQRMVKK